MIDLHKYDLKNQLIQSVLIFLFGAIPMGYFMCPSCFRQWDQGINVALMSGLMWLFLWKGNEYIYIITDRYVSWFRTPVKRMFIGLGLMIAYSTLMVSLITSLFFIFVFNIEIDDSFFSQLRRSAIITIIISTIIMMFFTARGFLLAWRQTAINVEKLRRAQVTSQYEALKNQVNPHFLFNSLNTLSSLVYDEPRRAVEFINRLSEVYRYVLDSKDREVVPLTEELSFVDSYLFLLESRFEKNLKVKMDVGDSNGYVPPMVLQMLIENAVKHNEISDDHPLSIKITAKDDYISVWNNLQPKKLKIDNKGIGLDNIRSRYGILSDLPVNIEQTSEHFEVCVPVLHKT